MKTMLTSFGVDLDTIPMLERAPLRSEDAFYLKPPVSMRSALTGFTQEYSLLILSEKLIFDERSFELLTEYPRAPFETVGRTLELLHREGFLDLLDYGAVLSRNMPLLTKMTDNDLKSIDQWTDSLGESLETWRTFMNMVRLRPMPSLDKQTYLQSAHMINNVLEGLYVSWQEHSQLGDDWNRRLLLSALKSYLRYVNANLILANEFEAGLHDWDDFLPFYRQKFLAVGRDNPGMAAQANASNQLFEIAFPELAIRTPGQLLRILQHKRVNELRTLIEEAANGKVTFDENFARSVFREVIGVERKLGRQRRLLGYLTIPIGFIPLVGNFAQLLLQEAAGTLMERKLTKQYRWFYMLSDISDKEVKGRS